MICKFIYYFIGVLLSRLVGIDKVNDCVVFEDKEIMEKYDVIYIGFPVWWYDLPMPVWTFLEEYDLSGKTIIPFFSHNGSSNGAGSLDTISNLAPNSEILSNDAISVRGSDVADSESKIKEWARKFTVNKGE